MRRRFALSLLLVLPLPACGAEPTAGGKATQRPPITNPPMDSKTQTATLAAGCFWCTEAVLQRIKGVEKIVSGYIGGKVKNPSYEEVCQGTTGHAEAVQVTFDPAVISYDKLLEVFWQLHDPTT